MGVPGTRCTTFIPTKTREGVRGVGGTRGRAPWLVVARGVERDVRERERHGRERGGLGVCCGGKREKL